VFYRATQNLGDHGYNVVFASPVVETIIAEGPQANMYAHVDATFKVVPVIFYQLCTFHVIVNDKVS
jgi:hypothetical protein